MPQPVAGLGRLETLKMGLNPLVDVADGPYLESLLHLDLRGSRIATLPQVAATGRQRQGATPVLLLLGRQLAALHSGPHCVPGLRVCSI